MMGTGTETDPYIVDNIADFRTACNKQSAYVELSKDIDCNDDDDMKSGWTTLYICCLKIDGKGYTIRNIYTNAGDQNAFVIGNNSMSGGGFFNLNFENILYNCTSTTDTCVFHSGGMGRFVNCNFSGIINSSATYCFCNMGIPATRCTFNFTVNSTCVSGFIFSKLRMESCEVKIKAKGKKNSSSSFMLAYNFSNSYAIGSIEFETKDTSSNTSRLAYQANNSYIALAMKNFSSGFSISYASVSLACFYDADLAGDVEFPAKSNVYALTAEQCKSKEYLNSIGFVVV